MKIVQCKNFKNKPNCGQYGGYFSYEFGILVNDYYRINDCEVTFSEDKNGPREYYTVEKKEVNIIGDFE